LIFLTSSDRMAVNFDFEPSPWVMTPSRTPLTIGTPSTSLNFNGVNVPPSFPPSAVLPMTVDVILP
jgi:hypothetical protein